MHEIKKLPFYSWDCITLYTAETQIDLVIKEQVVMDKFLMLLIHKLNTINGERGSGMNLRKYLVRQMTGEANLSKKEKNEIEKRVASVFVSQVLKSYKLVRMRQKITFACVIRGKTLTELFMEQIVNSFKFFNLSHLNLVDQIRKIFT